MKTSTEYSSTWKGTCERGGAAHQVAHDRREQHQHQQVVDRDLHQRVGRVAVGQVAPDEHHRRARRGGEDDAAGDVLVGVGRRDPRAEDMTRKKTHAISGHRERLHEPVHEQRDEQAARPAADVADRAEVDLHHHRRDHQPDEDRDRDVDLAARRRTRGGAASASAPGASRPSARRRPCRGRPRGSGSVRTDSVASWSSSSHRLQAGP